MSKLAMNIKLALTQYRLMDPDVYYGLENSDSPISY